VWLDVKIIVVLFDNLIRLSQNSCTDKISIRLEYYFVRIYNILSTVCFNKFVTSYILWTTVFHQHGATTHTAPLSMNILPAALPRRLLSRFGDIQWPSSSPDLTAVDFLWGYLKAQVFTHTLPDTNSLKNAIRQEIAHVTQDTVRDVMTIVPGRWQQCLDCHGGHL
jgi:hypothetical protein